MPNATNKAHIKKRTGQAFGSCVTHVSNGTTSKLSPYMYMEITITSVFSLANNLLLLHDYDENLMQNYFVDCVAFALSVIIS